VPFSRDVKVEAMKKTGLFADLSRKELRELAKVTEDVDVEAGAVLCKEGTTGQEFFVIMDGEVEITRRGKRISTQAQDEFFGEIALVEDIPRTATVTARTPLRFFVMTRQDFLRLLDAQPSIERKVLRALARRVADLTTDPTL
jgi:CRP/FNR family transcriptional regulator, cyclic AMP receptor protein